MKIIDDPIANIIAVGAPIENIFAVPIATIAIERSMYITKFQSTVAKSTPNNFKDAAILSIIMRIINLESR